MGLDPLGVSRMKLREKIKYRMRQKAYRRNPFRNMYFPFTKGLAELEALLEDRAVIYGGNEENDDQED